MSRITTAARFRLSASQRSIIWQGLDRIVNSYVARRTKGGVRYEYPFEVHPPPVGFLRGKFDRDFMNEIVGLWELLKPKIKTGGRVQMDAIELRASIFSIRANLDYVRSRRHFYRRASPEERAAFRLDDESFDQLKVKSKRVIHTLERHMKRADRTLFKSMSRDEHGLLTYAWRMHLLWMRLHIAYFKPSRGIRGRKVPTGARAAIPARANSAVEIKNVRWHIGGWPISRSVAENGWRVARVSQRALSS